jgi:hypothetical protein
MASLRVIKKDIDFLISEVISDCWVFLYINDGKKKDEIVAIINEAVDLRNALYSKVNNPDKENIKNHYRNINKELFTGVDTLFLKVSKLAEKK